MADRNYTALAIGGALIAGVAIGAAIGSRASHEIAAVSQRLDAVEARVSEKVDAMGGQVEEMVRAAVPADALSALSDRADALEGQMTEVTSKAQSATSDELKAVEQRVNTMAEQIAALIGRMNSAGSAQPAAPAGGASDAPAASSEAETPAADPTATQSAVAPSASETGAIDDLASRLGPNGAALAPGQTAKFGEASVFLSRIDTATGDARVLVVGQGPAGVGPASGSLSLPGGCTLSLVGVADGKAYLDAACGD
jgi:HAMP domain-containing protein